MSEVTNLASQIEKQLPAELVNFMQEAGEVAHRRGQSLYLVGGAVRDLILGRVNFDLDLVVEGDAIGLAPRLAMIKQAKVKTHYRFNTANLQWDKWAVDLATARSETYAKPGALPSVKPSALRDDLFRRDFTINAMAVYLEPSRYGELIDLYRGRNDLKRKLIRVLHKKSFTDDATRIWRSLRYEQRLNFRFEATTLKLLTRDISRLDTISGDRIRHELELIFGEKQPEKVLRRADKLGVLPKLHPALKGNSWLSEKFKQARQLYTPNLPPVGLYLSLLAYPLSSEENEHLISRLRLAKSLARTLRDANSIKDRLQSLTGPKLAPSSIYSILHEYSLLAVITNSLAAGSPVACQHIQLFLNKLCYVKPALNGEDLKRMGVVDGLQIREILHLLRQSRLDGKVTSKRGEEELVRKWLSRKMK